MRAMATCSRRSLRLQKAPTSGSVRTTGSRVSPVGPSYPFGNIAPQAVEEYATAPAPL